MKIETLSRQLAKKPLSRMQTAICLSLVMSLFVLLYSGNINNPVNDGYGATPKNYLSDCSLAEFPHVRGPVKAWMLCASDHAFGNINAVPFVSSLALIPVTFLLSREITKKPRVALASSFLLALSPIVGYLGTTAALSSDWALFLFLSLYAAYKRPELCGVFFFFSVASKGLPLLLLPAILYFVWKSEAQNKRTALVSFAVAGIVIIGIWGSGDQYLIQADGLRWNPDNALSALNNMWFVFRGDPLQLALVPAALAVTWLTKNIMGRPIFYMMALFYSLVFLLPVFSMYQMFDYRMIPLIMLSAIGIGMYRA